MDTQQTVQDFFHTNYCVHYQYKAFFRPVCILGSPRSERWYWCDRKRWCSCKYLLVLLEFTLLHLKT